MRKKLKHYAAERKPRQCGETAANSMPPENSPKWTVSIEIGKEVCTLSIFFGTCLIYTIVIIIDNGKDDDCEGDISREIDLSADGQEL